MTAPVRRGGRGTLADGTLLTWSIAEGARGRRWRATAVRTGKLGQAILLETGLDGRPARLEVSSAAGLLTLHPDPDERRLNGNVVTSDGIRHLAVDWSPDHELLVVGMPLTAMAAAHRLRTRLAIGETIERPSIAVELDLSCHAGHLSIARTTGDRWLMTGEGSVVEVAIDGDGAPASLGESQDWPLER